MSRAAAPKYLQTTQRSAPTDRSPRPSLTRLGAASIWSNLLLVRHGESTCNEVNRFAGSADAPLSDLGRAQARQAARAWRGSPPDLVFVSPLTRSRETAEILFPSAHLPHPHLIEPRITERRLGEFTLRNKADIQRELGVTGYDEALYGAAGSIAGAESFDSFRARVEDFLTNTLTPLLTSGRRVLVVAHKYVVELMARLILGLPTRDGYDLRLPNARVLRGSELGRYCRRESRTLNRLRDWAVLHHEQLLCAAALSGLSAACLGVPVSLHWSIGACLLAAATLISLLRVDLGRLSSTRSPSWLRVWLRFAAAPCVVGTLGLSLVSPGLACCGALLLSAPSATTSVTLSRCAGGVVLPAVTAIHRSSIIGCVVMAMIYQLWLGSNTWGLVLLLITVAWSMTLAPCAVARWLRRQAPIQAATWAERQTVLAVLLLCAFVFFACSRIDPAAFFPYGPAAVAISLLTRFVARCFAKPGALCATDSYLAMAYPNIFLVIIVGQLGGSAELTQLATWFLLPMFLLAPLDTYICRRIQAHDSIDQLRDYLGISPAPDRETLRPAPSAPPLRSLGADAAMEPGYSSESSLAPLGTLSVVPSLAD